VRDFSPGVKGGGGSGEKECFLRAGSTTFSKWGEEKKVRSDGSASGPREKKEKKKGNDAAGLDNLQKRKKERKKKNLFLRYGTKKKTSKGKTGGM